MFAKAQGQVCSRAWGQRGKRKGCPRPAHRGDQWPNPRPECPVTLPDPWPSFLWACSLPPKSLLLAQSRQRRGWGGEEGGGMATLLSACWALLLRLEETPNSPLNVLFPLWPREETSVGICSITCLDCCLPFYLKDLELGGHGCSLGSILLSPPPCLSSPGA